MTGYLLGLLCLILMTGCIISLPRCIRREFDQDSFVCVCNATYCDEVEIETELLFTYFSSYSSSRHGLRLEKNLGQFEDKPLNPDNVFEIVPNSTYQSIIGFGGAFTDAATIGISSLSQKAQEKLMMSYFSSSGLEYNVGRVPMAGCDFSTRLYSYDDTVNDTELTHFSLAKEDIKYKIPLLKMAMNMSTHNISVFGSPWSAPGWMKTNNKMTGKGTLRGEPGGVFFKSWAHYFVKFLQEYKKNGIDFWGVTAQNEPTDGMIDGFAFNCMGWTPELQRDFIAKDLGPALHANGFADIKLMIMDDQRLLLPYWPEKVFENPDAYNYVSGIAVHWYVDLFVPLNVLDFTHEKFPDKFIFNTEACEQDLLDKKKSVALGKWQRAERYFIDIMQDLNHWVTGWTDWNIALDMQGGPNWDGNFADSPVIVNADKDEFYKQPMFYAMGHFSKFIVPGSKRVGWTRSPGDAELAGFLRPDGSVAVLLGNFKDEAVNVTIRDSAPGLGYINYQLPARSFHTLIWWRK